MMKKISRSLTEKRIEKKELKPNPPTQLRIALRKKRSRGIKVAFVNPSHFTKKIFPRCHDTNDINGGFYVQILTRNAIIMQKRSPEKVVVITLSNVCFPCSCAQCQTKIAVFSSGNVDLL